MRLVEGQIDEARALQQQVMRLARAIGAQHVVPALKAALGLLEEEPAPL